MKTTYEAVFEATLAPVAPEIAKVEAFLNEAVRGFGVSDRLAIVSEGLIPPVLVSVDRDLTGDEQDRLRSAIESYVTTQFPQYSPRLVRFGKKVNAPEQAAA